MTSAHLLGGGEFWGPVLDPGGRGPIILVPFADIREVPRHARARIEALEPREGTNMHSPCLALPGGLCALWKRGWPLKSVWTGRPLCAGYSGAGRPREVSRFQTFMKGLILAQSER